MVQMGTVTDDVTPDGNHTVIMMMDQEMVFIENSVLKKYNLYGGIDVAFTYYTNDDGK